MIATANRLEAPRRASQRNRGTALIVLVLAILAAASPAAFRLTSASTLVEPRQSVRIRRNIDELSKPEHAAELKNLRHAFEVLVGRSLKDPNDPMGYIQFANFHNDGDIGPCDHVNDLFLAWHRAHLVAFEKALQDSDPTNAVTPTRDVMLPYWDWTATPSGSNGYPKVVEDKLVDGKANIFYWPNKSVCDKLSFVYCDERNKHSAGAAPFPKAVADEILKEPWDKFGGTPTGSGALEANPHNFMHGAYVGSDMADNATAAYDPVFWFFHTNIDRLMQKWQVQHQKAPCDPADPQHVSSLDTLVKGTGNWPPTGAVRDFICVEKLGYAYDQLPTDPQPPSPVLTMSAPPAFAVPMGIGIVASAGRKVTRNLPSPGGVFERAYLEFPKVALPSQGSYDVRVYLHPKGEKERVGNREFAGKYFAGSFVVWALRHQMRGKAMAHGGNAAFSVNVTRRLQEVLRTTTGNAIVATIVFSPRNKAPDRLPLDASDPLALTVDTAAGRRAFTLTP